MTTTYQEGDAVSISTYRTTLVFGTYAGSSGYTDGAGRPMPLVVVEGVSTLVCVDQLAPCPSVVHGDAPYGRCICSKAAR